MIERVVQIPDLQTIIDSEKYRRIQRITTRRFRPNHGDKGTPTRHPNRTRELIETVQSRFAVEREDARNQINEAVSGVKAREILYDKPIWI